MARWDGLDQHPFQRRRLHATDHPLALPESRAEDKAVGVSHEAHREEESPQNEADGESV